MIRSADGYLDALEFSIAKATLNNNRVTDGKYNILEGGNICLEYTDNKCSNILKVETKGEVPNSGIIEIKDGKIENIGLTYPNNQTIIKKDNELVFGDFPLQLLPPGLYDENNNLKISWRQLTSDEILEADTDGDGIYEKSPLLLVNADGVLTTKQDIDYGYSLSSEYLVGKLIIDESVTSIERSAFSGCTSLTSITIPASVTSMEYGVFEGCTGLTSAIIGASSIGDYAFYGCTG